MGIENRSYYVSEEPRIIAEIGSGKPRIIFNVGTHGNELQPVLAAEDMIHFLSREELKTGTISFTVANPPALRAQKRFLQNDLNRSYPGDIGTTGEKRIAAQMLPLIKDADYVVDFHTAPQSPPVVILGSRNEERLQLAEASGIEPIVLFEGPTPVAMVDFVKCGVGIELGQHSDEQSKVVGLQVMENYLKTLGFMSGNPLPVNHQYFEVVRNLPFEDVREKPYELLKDFQPIDKSIFNIDHEEVLYPFLTGTQSYSSICCFLVRQVERDYLTHY